MTLPQTIKDGDSIPKSIIFYFLRFMFQVWKFYIMATIPYCRNMKSQLGHFCLLTAPYFGFFILIAFFSCLMHLCVCVCELHLCVCLTVNKMSGYNMIVKMSEVIWT